MEAFGTRADIKPHSVGAVISITAVYYVAFIDILKQKYRYALCLYYTKTEEPIAELVQKTVRL